jgi:hypothetical protein
MENRTEIKLSIHTIINLIICAEDYGFTQLYSDFFQMLDNKLSDSEIEDYIEVYMEQYEDEDIESSTEQLKELRDRYCGE